MKTRSLMVLGTSSGVGKSFVAAAFCRLFSDWGLRVAPFKAQNMSNNSFVTPDGGEIGRAQAVQAECARAVPSVHMNPVLLKPSGEQESQVVLQGRPAGHFRAREYFEAREKAQAAIRDSYERLCRDYDFLVIEGAGSPAEVNLKPYDLVNMHTAKMADARCVLVADIDRGGVFASVLGTLELLAPDERALIDGIIINKFRGDISLFRDGVDFIESKTGKKVWGVLPFDRDLQIPEEDSLRNFSRGARPGELDIAVVLLPRLSNFTDFDPLAEEPGVCLRYVAKPEDIGNPDLLILPGTKSTAADYRYLVEKGFRAPVLRYAAAGGRILGICGGYQMMGSMIRDFGTVESGCVETEGFGFFEMDTEFQSEKVLRQVNEKFSGRFFDRPVEAEITAYEIHMGVSKTRRAYAAFGPGGAISESGKIFGTYYHGLFDSGSFRAAFLNALAGDAGKKRTPAAASSHEEVREKQYQKLAQFLAQHINLDALSRSLGISVPAASRR